jgi:hypothetical protein
MQNKLPLVYHLFLIKTYALIVVELYFRLEVLFAFMWLIPHPISDAMVFINFLKSIIYIMPIMVNYNIIYLKNAG